MITFWLLAASIHIELDYGFDCGNLEMSLHHTDETRSA